MDRQMLACLGMLDNSCNYLFELVSQRDAAVGNGP
jgi:hypothetical protein